MAMGEPRSILIADDDALIRRMFGIMLSKAGYEVIQAGDGREALAQIARHRPDLLVLDFMMPYLTGVEVLKQLARNPQTASLPVLMISAAVTEADLAGEPVMQQMRVELLSKPVGFKELVDCVERLLQQAPQPEGITAHAAARVRSMDGRLAILP